MVLEHELNCSNGESIQLHFAKLCFQRGAHLDGLSVAAVTCSQTVTMRAGSAARVPPSPGQERQGLLLKILETAGSSECHEDRRTGTEGSGGDRESK